MLPGEGRETDDCGNLTFLRAHEHIAGVGGASRHWLKVGKSDSGRACRHRDGTEQTAEQDREPAGFFRHAVGPGGAAIQRQAAPEESREPLQTGVGGPGSDPPPTQGESSRSLRPG